MASSTRMQSVTGSDTTRAHQTELLRIGSGKNHVAAHLALHQYFVLNSRPVPRFLMLDQPTRLYLPLRHGRTARTARRHRPGRRPCDRHPPLRTHVPGRQGTVPNFQMIVSDHADLPHDWYQDSVRYNWRNGEKLIPPPGSKTSPPRSQPLPPSASPGRRAPRSASRRTTSARAPQPSPLGRAAA
ncbi:DUF3732 domain-containing protein [Streptomyces uncialis]|uniref:DUF3732 domain-containing protein n=1 Tax=Streptomyces uncialis TaxID=1048205 RepID=UPI0038107D52